MVDFSLKRSMSSETRKLHVAMLPWLAFGHITKYIELANRIARKGHTVSFLSTPRNISRIPNIPADLSSHFKFIPLPFPRHENIPDGAESTTDIPVDKMPYLFLAMDALQEPFSKFLEHSRPDWVVHDFCYHWVPPLARKLGVSSACFVTMNAWAACYFGPPDWAMIDGQDPRVKPEDFAAPPPWVPFETSVHYRMHEAKKMFGHGPPPRVSEVPDAVRIWLTMTGCDYVLIKTCSELESEWIDLFGKLTGKPVVPVGLLPPPVIDDVQASDDDAWHTISNWLDKQNKKSVVYVALGSEVNVGRNDIVELALGLELSGLPFFWALRKPKESESHAAELLPEGFEEKVKDRGCVWKTWAPQVKILSHDSVGGFVTHCGWGSVVEGLSYGVPLVMLPYMVDQPLIARVFAEKKVGVEISRDESDGSFTSKSVADSVRLVVAEDKGRSYRDNALGMRKVFADEKLQERYIEHLVEILANHNFTRVV